MRPALPRLPLIALLKVAQRAHLFESELHEDGRGHRSAMRDEAFHTSSHRDLPSPLHQSTVHAVSAAALAHGGPAQVRTQQGDGHMGRARRLTVQVCEHEAGIRVGSNLVEASPDIDLLGGQRRQIVGITESCRLDAHRQLEGLQIGRRISKRDAGWDLSEGL
jgi:hypothetical protein